MPDFRSPSGEEGPAGSTAPAGPAQQAAPSVAERLQAVRRRIEQAARRAGRDPDSVQLVAVSKGVDAARIRQAVAAGQRVFGENRVQELVAKAEALRDLGIQWHMVGHLQRNKARDAARLIAMLHSLDSLRLAGELHRRLELLGRRLAVLVQVNISGEPGKFGVPPEQAVGLVATVASRFSTLEVVGLMAIGPNVRDEQVVRRSFRQMRELFEAIREQGAAGQAFRHLSMGMSADFEWAIEEGATIVRIGTAIFGRRAAHPGPGAA